MDYGQGLPECALQRSNLEVSASGVWKVFGEAIVARPISVPIFHKMLDYLYIVY